VNSRWRHCFFNSNKFVLLFAFTMLNALSAFAGPSRTTYQAKIVKPNGYPLEASSVNFRFSVLDSVGSCVLYVEDYTAVNMNASGGLISFALGSGVRSFPASGTAQTFQNTFDNSTTSFSCQAPGIYNPGPNDTRKIVMQFNDGLGWQTLPSMSINAVPYAMYADKAQDAQTLNGKSDTAFVENATLAALSCNSTTHAITFNGVSFSCIPVSSGSVTSVTTSGSVLITGGTSAAPVISITAATMSQDGYLTSVDYAEFKAKLSASSSQIVSTLGYAPVSGAAVTTQINNANLSGDVSGTVNLNSVVSVGGKSSAQISASVDSTLAATSSATADTIVKRNSSGNSSFSTVSANSASLNYVDIYKPSTSFNIRLQAPTSLSANYTLNLPTTSGTTGQVLSTDGLGNLSWINSATGSVTSVSGTLNEITSTGGSTPSLGLANAGTAGTYYKVITDTKGRVTSGVTTLILSDLPNTVLNATSNFSGDISGIISNITVNRIQGVSVTITSLATNDILQYDGLKYINKNIPTCSGSQYLTFNGTSFSCMADAGASGTITTLSVTGPISSTGGSNPILSISQANSSTNGFLSSTDFNTFNNKQTATSSAIIATLGYTPADSAASGTYLQKTNNLSDLTNVVAARTNLGLGSLAVGNSIDLSSASATGVIADARLATQLNVTSGTQYTKLTVDGKGRVISGAQLTSSDVTTALGYTPSNAASGVTTLNGLTVQTQTFLVGIAGTNFGINSSGSNHTFNIPLAASGSVAAGLLSNTDYVTFNNKQTATSSAIIATLGYTPADSAASGTHLQKTNNLSDLTNVVAARTNLGLGSLAVANTVDLGSASATGTLAIARLPNFNGDATIAAASNTIVLSNSGVTAGTYTKVIVDAKGRVTSSSVLASSDVTTALGYTPANSASGVTSLNGSVSQTQTFATNNTGTAFGITTANGVHTINIPLAASSSVTAGLLSNADYTTFTNKQNATSAAIIATLGYTPANATSATQWTTNGSSIYYTGNIGVGILNPTAKLELASGTASVAPLKFTSGTLLSSAQSGTMEYDGFNFYLTDSTNTRRTIATGSSAGSIDNASNINSSSNITMTPTGSVIVSSTTASTNSNTGALVVKGGLGVAGNINTAGNLNVSGSSVIDGSLKLSTMTSGSMLFAGANGVVTQDNSSLFWDGANKRLGIGGNSPAQTLSVSGTSYFSGNVGIGTTSPQQKLHIDGAGILRMQDNDDISPHGYVEFGVTTAGLWSRKGYIGMPGAGAAELAIAADGAGTPIYFKNTTGTVMTVSGSNVGIGTTSPEMKLDVSGNIRSSQNFLGPQNSQFGIYTDSSYATGAAIQLYGTGGTPANSLLFLTGSTIAERMRIDSSGNVGIGTASPNQGSLVISNSVQNSARLVLSGQEFYQSGNTSTDGLAFLLGVNRPGNRQLWIADSANLAQSTSNTILRLSPSSGDISALATDGVTNKALILNAGGGNVGIGTTAPTAKLEVAGAAALSTAVDVGINLSLKNTAIGNTWNLYNLPSSDGQSPNGLLFENCNGGCTRKMTLTASGNVGIGTTSPGNKLEVATGNISAVSGNVHTNRGRIAFSNTATDVNHTIYNNYNNIDGEGVWDGMKMNVYQGLSIRVGQANSATPTTAFHVNSTGNVGIGTTTPSKTLEVSGTVKATAFSGPGILLQTINLSAADFVSNTTSVWSDVPNLSSTFTTAVAATVDIVASGMYRTMNSSVGNVRLVINGTEVAGDYIPQAPSAGTWHANTSINWAQTLAAGTHTIKVQWRNENATGSFDQGWNDSGRVLSRRLKIMVYSQ